MLDDGEKLVPGFREARALRVWTGVRPLFEDAKASETDTRDVTRAHALLDHQQRDGVARLRDDHRRQADDLPADGRGDGRRRLPSARRARARARTETEPLPGSESGQHLPAGRAAGAQGGARCATSSSICECELVPRSKLEQAIDAHRQHQPRRHPPPAAPRHGSVPGWLLHLPRRPASCTGSTGSHARAGRRVAAGLPAGALEGRRGRCSTATSCARRGSTTGSSTGCSTWSILPSMNSELHFDAVVIGAGTAGLAAGARLAQAGARVCVLAKGIGSTHLAPATIDVLGYAPERVAKSSAGRSSELIAARPDHPYALLGSSSSPRRSAGSRRRVADGPLPGYAYAGGPERNLLLPTRRSARCARRRSSPRRWPPAIRAQLGRVCIVGTPALRDFHPQPVRRQPDGGRDRGARREPRAQARARRRERARDRPPVRRSALAGPVLRRARRWRCAPRSTSACRRCSGCAIRTACWSTSSSGSAAACSRSPRCRRRCRGCGCTRSCALPCALPAAGWSSARGGGAPSATAIGVASVSTRAAGRDVSYAAAWFVLAAGGFASGAIELDSRWVTARARARPAAARTARRRRAAVRRRRTSTSSRWPGSASRSTASCAREGVDNVRRRRRGAARRGAVARGTRARASRWPADTERRRWSRRRCRARRRRRPYDGSGGAGDAPRHA